MSEQACCSHSKITRHRQEYPGFTSEYWQCDTCETRFFPEPTDMSRRKLRQQFAAAALGPLVQSAIAEGHEAWFATVQHAAIIANLMLEELDK